MFTFFRTIALCLMLLALFFNVGGQEKHGNTEKITGVVVAEYFGMPFHACWHVCGLSLVVKLDKPNPEKFVVVHVEYMDDHSLPRNGLPLELVERSRRWKFDARRAEGDECLQEFMKFIDQDSGKDVSRETAIPAWKLLKGAEQEKLPYGETLPTYNVRVGRFKLVS